MASHTASGEWQTFELRMRRRRVARLLERAEAAVRAGRHDEARACLEEAESLSPGLPDIHATRERLARPASSQPVRSAFRRTVWGASTAIATIAIVFGYRPPALLPSQDLRAVAMSTPIVKTPAPPAVAAALADRALPAVDPVPPDEPIRRVEPIDNDEPPAARVRPGPAAVRPKTADPRTESIRATDAQPAVIGPRRDGPSHIAPASEVAAVATAGVPLPSPPPSSIPASAPSTSAAAGSIPAFSPSTSASAPSRPETAPSTPAPPASASASTVPADVAVRRTLDGYAAAYTALDATAAQRVWPTVNRGALAHAFGTLASQRVSLGNCRIEITGVLARASCAGAVTWAARIGDRTSRTDARQWTFDLARDAAGWRILNARAQNR